MNITFLAGADEVGASCILIEIGGRRLLVDAGIRVEIAVAQVRISAGQGPQALGLERVVRWWKGD